MNRSLIEKLYSKKHYLESEIEKYEGERQQDREGYSEDASHQTVARIVRSETLADERNLHSHAMLGFVEEVLNDLWSGDEPTKET